MELSRQAWILLIVYVMATIILTAGVASSKDGGMGTAVSSFVAMAISAMILVFEINCLTEGGCNKFSWFKTFMYSLTPVAVIILGSYVYKNKDKLNS